VSNGRYRSPAWILREEGGKDDAEAVASTKRFMEKCIRMGAPWVKKNNQFGRYDFLVLEEGFEESFSKAWAEKTKEDDASLPPPKADCAPPPLAHSAAASKDGKGASKENADAGKDAAKGSKGAATDGNDAIKDAAKGSKDAGKDASKTQLAKANALKSRYSGVASGANAVLESIAKNPSWQWAKNASEDLRAAVKRLEDILGTNPFFMDFLTLPTPAVKKNHAGTDWEQDLAVFVATGADLVATVAKETSQLIAMHTARKS
jgi:hypothetical protein